MKWHRKMIKSEQIDIDSSCSTLGDLKNILISLQLVNKSLVHPKGVVKDVLVKSLTLRMTEKPPFCWVGRFWPLQN
ncbi:hypothetical protein EPI10_016049 [Gossypium australe]|uniref:Uncharacterized protein n=1 Tax=Gossypium australe TaxID=47621 RepID=A0A5B6VMN6_9ROSI|nr:hypothetical protein EPI10_016049 [Gossypium australe]